MARAIVLLLLLAFVTHSFYRMWKGIREGLRGTPAGRGAPRAAARMVRDPVCGTFVLPDRALSLAVGQEQHFFCSAACRDKYRARTA